MRQYRQVVQRCLSGTAHPSSLLCAASTTTQQRNASRSSRHSAAAAVALDNDGNDDTVAAARYGGATAATSGSQRRSRRTPAQLLADLNREGDSGKRSGGGGGASSSSFSASSSSSTAAAAMGDPVALLLHKHDARGGAATAAAAAAAAVRLSSGTGGGRDMVGGGSGGSGGGGDRGKGRPRKAPLTPPTRAETAAAAADEAGGDEAEDEFAEDAPHRRGGGGLGGSARHKQHKHDKAAGRVTSRAKAQEGETEEEEDESSSSSSISVVASSDSPVGAGDHPTALQILTNPFRGLHTEVARSYRIDQLLEESTPADVLLARQERKSTAFSFMKFKAGEAFYKGHWASLPEMQHQLDSMGSASARTQVGPYVRGQPIPGLTLFNNDLGLNNPMVQCSYPLILAQRMLLFPDHLRQFHAICGRQDVPCDFFADIDLPGESQAGGEKALMDVINYLEVRLPGIGFTNPFFLILTNAVPGTDKVSYHLHARSMTYVHEWRQRAELEVKLGGSIESAKKRLTAKSKAKSKKSKKKKTSRGGGRDASNASTTSAADDDEDDMFAVKEGEGEEGDNSDYDDLSDMVNVVDNKVSSLGSSTKLIAFQDFRSVKLLSDEVNQTLGRDLIDMNCYRPNGMLRCAFSSKLPSTQDHDFHAQQQQQQHHHKAAVAAALRKRLVPLVTAKDSALQRRLTDMEAVLRTMTDPEILEMTFCTRHIDSDPKVLKQIHQHAQGLVIMDSHAPLGSPEQQRSAQVLQATQRHRWKLIRPRHIVGPQAAQAVEYDAYGNVVSPFLTEGAKWRRFKAVTAKLRTLPPRAAESYDVWVRVGLALHNFSNEDACFEEWVLFSLKSPQKYSRDVCRKKWMQFERNPDALNWRRGYNYLNSTVWRQVQS